MHELPVTQGILSVALQAAERARAHRITQIDLLIGDLSSIVDDSVQFYFDILSKGTPAEGANLVFRRRPAIATCLDCSTQSEATIPISSACPSCGSLHLQITGGTEFRVESIDVDEVADVPAEGVQGRSLDGVAGVSPGSSSKGGAVVSPATPLDYTR